MLHKGKWCKDGGKRKKKSLNQILSTNLEQHFFLLHKIPINCDADFNTIFILVKVRVHKLQNKSV